MFASRPGTNPKEPEAVAAGSRHAASLAQPVGLQALAKANGVHVRLDMLAMTSASDSEHTDSVSESHGEGINKEASSESSSSVDQLSHVDLEMSESGSESEATLDSELESPEAASKSVRHKRGLGQDGRRRPARSGPIVPHGPGRPRAAARGNKKLRRSKT